MQRIVTAIHKEDVSLIRNEIYAAGRAFIKENANDIWLCACRSQSSEITQILIDMKVPIQQPRSNGAYYFNENDTLTIAAKHANLLLAQHILSKYKKNPVQIKQIILRFMNNISQNQDILRLFVSNISSEHIVTIAKRAVIAGNAEIIGMCHQIDPVITSKEHAVLLLKHLGVNPIQLLSQSPDMSDSCKKYIMSCMTSEFKEKSALDTAFEMEFSNDN